jgi:hypothetical protein
MVAFATGCNVSGFWQKQTRQCPSEILKQPAGFPKAVGTKSCSNRFMGGSILTIAP